MHISSARAGAGASARDRIVRDTVQTVYRFVDHTAELELQLEAATREGVLAEAVVALGELLGGAVGTALVHRDVQAEATDDAALLAAWLDELVFLAEMDGFVPERAVSVHVTGHAASGVVEGRLGRPPHLVKGVTYNDLELRSDGEAWHGRVVLDV
jgi:SHS2 domain-containing protein